MVSNKMRLGISEVGAMKPDMSEASAMRLNVLEVGKMTFHMSEASANIGRCKRNFKQQHHRNMYVLSAPSLVWSKLLQGSKLREAIQGCALKMKEAINNSAIMTSW